ncbi:MAG: class I SAM-dependent methyltransferase [Planctomycetia bacterium]|jgi:S-adenosylmethionine-diacylgycerolhomoserine-N-methlytransferase|nr:class I SAM-dependent methyltransferase [Planctomycetia bacterium]
MNEPVSDSPLSASSNRSSSNNLGNVAADQAVAMDRMYRVTRHIYDLTRRYYLLGRDRLLEKVITSPTTATLEVGCGTARNLIKLAGRQHSGLLYGLDASHEMLETAAANSIRACTKRIGQEQIVLRQGLAEQLDAQRMFGRSAPFDTILFSYCLSMIPTWPGAIDAALANVRTGGVILIVDFWDQKDLPAFFATGLKRWLSLFHVHYRPEVHEALVEVGESGRGEVSFESVARRYAYIATIRKT